MRKLMLAVLLAPMLGVPVRAEEALVTYKSMNVDLALSLARAALTDCQKRGYQVSVAVVDRSGITQVLLRDRFAGAHTVTTATGKAWTTASFHTNTSELVAATLAGSPQAGVRALPGAIVIAGGVMVEAGGALVGAIGVSGAPGGENDEVCAKAGVAAVRGKLDF